MASVQGHYENLLAPIYLWMAGGIDAALTQGASDISPFVSGNSTNPVAIDLGAGFGMHAIPLARSGFAVTAIDTSDVLLAELQKYAQGLSIQVVNADLIDFHEHVEGRADLILCMGDTLTHLQEVAHVEHLFERVAGALAPTGRAVFTFRDYTNPPQGDARFIPIRSDADRIHTCFLEESTEHMIVHDLLHERQATSWSFRASSYKKIRLSPERVLTAMERVGLKATIEEAARGMLRVVANGD